MCVCVCARVRVRERIIERATRFAYDILVSRNLGRRIQWRKNGNEASHEPFPLPRALFLFLAEEEKEKTRGERENYDARYKVRHSRDVLCNCRAKKKKSRGRDRCICFDVFVSRCCKHGKERTLLSHFRFADKRRSSARVLALYFSIFFCLSISFFFFFIFLDIVIMSIYIHGAEENDLRCNRRAMHFITHTTLRFENVRVFRSYCAVTMRHFRRRAICLLIALRKVCRERVLHFST